MTGRGRSLKPCEKINGPEAGTERCKDLLRQVKPSVLQYKINAEGRGKKACRQVDPFGQDVLSVWLVEKRAKGTFDLAVQPMTTAGAFGYAQQFVPVVLICHWLRLFSHIFVIDLPNERFYSTLSSRITQ